MATGITSLPRKKYHENRVITSHIHCSTESCYNVTRSTLSKRKPSRTRPPAAARRTRRPCRRTPELRSQVWLGHSCCKVLQRWCFQQPPKNTNGSEMIRKNGYKKNSAWTLQRISQRASTVAPAAGKCRHQLDREQETAHQHDRGQEPADPQAVARGVAANEGAEVLAHGSKRR